MKGKQALLVDFDGTLADTGAANHAAYAHALGEVGLTVAREPFDRVAFGRSWRQFLPELLAEHGIDAVPQAIAERKAAVYPGYFDLIGLNTALLRMMVAHRAYGPVALVTTASGVNVRAILAHFDLVALFDTIVTGDDVTRHKPDPEAYHLAASRLSVIPADCVVVEDSAIGIAAGRAFGAPVLQVIL
jgi:beta-phosphoglucomutase-like phosphatase (HAD superfamily)